MHSTIIFFLLAGFFIFPLASLHESIPLFALGRVVGGFGAGCATVLVPLYLGQVAPLNLRGAIGNLHQVGDNCFTFTLIWMFWNIFGLCFAAWLARQYILGSGASWDFGWWVCWTHDWFVVSIGLCFLIIFLDHFLGWQQCVGWNLWSSLCLFPVSASPPKVAIVFGLLVAQIAGSEHASTFERGPNPKERALIIIWFSSASTRVQS